MIGALGGLEFFRFLTLRDKNMRRHDRGERLVDFELINLKMIDVFKRVSA